MFASRPRGTMPGMPRSVEPGSDIPAMTAGPGVIIPVAFGTVRIAGQIIERDGPWSPSMSPGLNGELGMSTGKGQHIEQVVVPQGGFVQVSLYAGWTRTGLWDPDTGTRLIPGTLPYDLTAGTAAGYTEDGHGGYTFNPSHYGHTISISYEYDFSGDYSALVIPGYIFDAVIGLCEGPIASVGRMWLGKQVFPSVGVPSSTGSVTAAVEVKGSEFATTLTQADGYFTGGLLEFTSGANKNWQLKVTNCKNTNGVVTLESAPGGGGVAVGDTFTIYPGYNPLKYNLLTGTQPQVRPTWKTTTSYNVLASDTYPNTACIFLRGASGASSDIPEMSWEVGAQLITSGVDANPADMLNYLLTSARGGGGWSGSKVHSSVTGSGPADMRTYAIADQLVFSWLIDSQGDIGGLIEQLLLASNTDAVWSGGQFKVKSRCTQAIGGFTPSVVPLFDLGPDDFSSPPRFFHVRPADTYNRIPVEYTDRSMAYARNVVDDPDMADVDLRGKPVPGSTVSLPFVMSSATATKLSRLFAQRSLYVRDTWEVDLAGSFRFALTEPTDDLTISDPAQEISRRPVRITAWEESLAQDGDARLTITAEDFPIGHAAAATYVQQAGDGYRGNLDNPLNKYFPPPASVGDSQSTRGADVDNIWPNGTSENSPPAGADLLSPEWANRAPSDSAYAGAWVRELVAPTSVDRIIAIGSTACSYSDDDGTTWTNRSSQITGQIWDVACNDDRSMYVAVGQAATAYESLDGGVVWSPTWVAGDANWHYYGVAWNGLAFVAVGYDATNSQPKWCLKGPWGNGYGSIGAETGIVYHNVAWVGRLFFAFAQNGRCATCGEVLAAGMVWTVRVLAGSAQRRAVAWNGAIYCVVGDSGSCDTSPDGLVWTSRTIPNTNYYGIAWNGSVFCALGYNNSVATSPDGTTWTNHTILANASWWQDIIWTGSLFVVVGQNTNVVLTSPDGVTWTQHTMPASGYYTSLCAQPERARLELTVPCFPGDVFSTDVMVRRTAGTGLAGAAILFPVYPDVTGGTRYSKYVGAGAGWERALATSAAAPAGATKAVISLEGYLGTFDFDSILVRRHINSVNLTSGGAQAFRHWNVSIGVGATSVDIPVDPVQPDTLYSVTYGITGGNTGNQNGMTVRSVTKAIDKITITLWAAPTTTATTIDVTLSRGA
jgi:hypothetical protein